MKKIIQMTEEFVRRKLGNESSGHDWYHIHRVRQLALKIAEQEGADVFICELAALLHDIADEKIAGSEEAGLAEVSDWLRTIKLEAQVADAVLHIIQNMSYKGGHAGEALSLEGRVVQDADRLDAIGAIGIGRTFAYSGAKGQLMFDPEIPVREEMTKEEYRNGKSTAINHFYEKLLKLKSGINTPYANKLAEERHQFMEDFLQRFSLEWEGKK
ncbi:HD domain-containing protein [Fictibacillus aquaticus]|uniref:Phosphohydrolase n=1 Tax=Fictibacillus aquaticus TaxID=2021314 RepID=A0A235FCL7_9BACL|nr:HD domain-containing protein [Fictibacillus aquaticus]OYD58697.1 phosphohydrolase [Fictibacillus aquaticus]